jgi:hypothetical protein
VYDITVQAFPPSMGKAVSKKDREERDLVKDKNLMYGEINFESLGLVFEKIKMVYGMPNVGTSGSVGFLQRPGGIFYDLGSGTGKVAVAAAILHNFDVCYGIETLEGLYSVSLDTLNAYGTKGKSKMPPREKDTHCQMINGSFLKMKTKDWRDADIVFANSTCYDEILMGHIAKLAQGLRKGAFFISLTKRLPSSEFVVLEYEMYRMSWGEATVYIMQKQTDAKITYNAHDSDSDDG